MVLDSDSVLMIIGQICEPKIGQLVRLIVKKDYYS